MIYLREQIRFLMRLYPSNWIQIVSLNGYPAADLVKNAVLLQIYYLIHQKRKVAATSVVENLYSGQTIRMKLFSID